MQNASQKGFSVFGIRTLTPFESAIGLSSAVRPYFTRSALTNGYH
jgi:hypothetical protein